MNDRIRTLLRRLDEHAPGERIHAERVAVYSVATGHRLGLGERDLLHLRWAAELHDIGKLLVDADVLRSATTPDEAQIAEMRVHILFAKAALGDLEMPAAVVRAVRLHHERWDGSGYPFEYRGEITPLPSRIIGLAEWFDVAANGTNWCRGIGEGRAASDLPKQPFDPMVVEAFLKVQPLIQPVSVA